MQPRQSEKFVKEELLLPEPRLATDLETRGSWLEVPPSDVEQFERLFWPRWYAYGAGGEFVRRWPDLAAAVRSAKHAILKVFPELVRCDRNDIRAAHLQNDDGAWRIWVYDNFTNGLGIADRFFDEPSRFLEVGLELIERCTCNDDAGCPVCLQHVHHRRDNGMVSKLAGRFLLGSLLKLPLEPVLADLQDYLHVAVPPSDVIADAYQAEANRGARSPQANGGRLSGRQGTYGHEEAPFLDEQPPLTDDGSPIETQFLL